MDWLWGTSDLWFVRCLEFRKAWKNMWHHRCNVSCHPLQCTLHGINCHTWHLVSVGSCWYYVVWTWHYTWSGAIINVISYSCAFSTATSPKCLHSDHCAGGSAYVQVIVTGCKVVTVVYNISSSLFGWDMDIQHSSLFLTSSTFLVCYSSL